MKIRASFLLTLFAIILLLPAELFACACCAERGHYSLSYDKPTEYLLEEIQRLRFSTAELYMTAAGEEDIKGLNPIGESYQINGLLKNNTWNLNFTDNNKKTGTLSLPMPEKIVDFSVDIHDGGDSGAGSPNLYKELRFKFDVKNGTGIFKDGIRGKTEYFLVLQGRGNACTFAENFKNWRLEITGKNTKYAFFGKLSTDENTAMGDDQNPINNANFLVTNNSIGNFKVGMTIGEARKFLKGAKLSRSEEEGFDVIEVEGTNLPIITFSVPASDDNYEAPVDDKLEIFAIDTRDARFKTAEGVHSGMKISDAEKQYGKLKQIWTEGLTGDEIPAFSNHPKGIDFTVASINREQVWTTAGIYAKDQETTAKYKSGAFISSISVPARYGGEIINNNSGMAKCTVVTSSGNLNVRSFEGKIIGSLKKGTIVFLNERTGDGRSKVSEIQNGGLVEIGYVSNDFLNCDEGESTEANSPNNVLKFGNITSDFSGCSCLAQSLSESKKPDGKFMFYSDLEDSDKSAIFNINGKDTTFKLIKKGKRPEVDRIGSRFTDIYEANGITIEVDYRTLQINHESADYDITLTARKGNLQISEKVVGSCGC